MYVYAKINTFIYLVFSARREFLSYCLSLMRAHNAEHRDSLPVLDVSSLRHVAYVLDALIYLMRGGSGASSANEPQTSAASLVGERGDREPYFWQISDAVCS